MWLFWAISAYFLLAVVTIMDKLIVTKSAQKPIVYTFYSSIFLLGCLFLLPFANWEMLKGVDWWWAISSGVAYGLAMWTFYIGVKDSETSHIGPFNGAIFTAGIYLFASSILGEKLTVAQIIGTVVLGIACLSLSFERSQKHRGFHVGFLWAGLSGLLFAFSHVSSAYLYGIYPFLPALIWSKSTIGLVGLFVLLFPSVRKALTQKTQAKSYARKNAKLIILVDKVLATLALLFLQFAYSQGVVTVVGAVGGVQFAFTFIIIYLSTKFSPKVFKEYFTKREFVIEVFATLLVVIGSILFMF